MGMLLASLTSHDTSVPDPFNFDMDPDLWKNGSGSCIGPDLKLNKMSD